MALKNLGTLTRNLEDMRSDLVTQQTKNMFNPFRNVVKEEIKEILEAEKRFDKVWIKNEKWTKADIERMKIDILKFENFCFNL